MTRLQKFTDYGLLDETWFDKLVNQYADQYDLLDDYTVYKEGSTYYVVGQRQVHTEDGLVAAIQWAHDQLPSNGGSIGVRSGLYSKAWEDKLTISKNCVRFHGTQMGSNSAAGIGGCMFEAIDNLDKDMIEITGIKTHIHDFCLQGNKNNQSSGRGIYDFSGASGDTHARDVYVFNTKGDGWHWRSGAGLAVGCYVEYAGGYGFYTTMHRNVFVQCGAYASGKSGWIIACERSRFLGCIGASNYGDATYEGHGFILLGTNKSVLIGCYAQDSKRHGFSLQGSSRNSLIGCVAHSSSQKTDNTYDGINLTTSGSTHSIRNMILGCQIFNEETNKHRYGIREEDSNQDYNKIGFCNVEDSQTAAISLQGANSEKAYCNEG